MDFKPYRLIFLVVVSATVATRASAPIFGQDYGSIDKTLAVCGGTIESDSDRITYSALNQGEVCVWVIHLQTRMGFRFNFSQFDVSSDYMDCRDGGIRIYALTNLAPPDEWQSYGYCNNRPPPPEIFLGFSIAVVILHIGSENSSPGFGFELNWSGSSVDPLRTKHVSSYSTAPEGLIKYPVVGSYPTSVAATWLVKPQSAQRPINVDLSISQIGLEECSLDGSEDPCACDSLILYQIGNAGHLNESRRMCGDEAAVDFYNLENRFLLAFFTDLEDLAGGDGFTAIYYPSQVSTAWPTSTPSTVRTSEPTTTERTTTSEPTTTDDYYTTPKPPDTPCGQILHSSTNWGAVYHKLIDFHDPHDRCTWTITNREYSAITFENLGWISANVYVYISTFTNQGLPLLVNDRLNASTTNYNKTVPGSLAIVTFAADAQSRFGGMNLRFRSEGPPPANISLSSRDVNMEVVEWDDIQHPASGSGIYFNNELSSFLVNKLNHAYNGEHLDYYFQEYDTGSMADDFVEVYRFSYLNGWTYYHRFSYYHDIIQHDDLVLFLFLSNNVNTGRGFIISIGPYNSYTTPWTVKRN